MDSPMLILACAFAISFLHTSEACRQPIGWQAKPLTARATQARDIVYGQVTGIFQGTSPEEYLVEMNILCVMKGRAQPGRVNITEIGTDCVDNAMRKGGSYIVFINMVRDGAGRNRYVTNDINVEMAAHRATEDNFGLIRKAGVNNPCNQVQYQPAVDPAFEGGAAGQCGRNGTNCGSAGTVLIAGSLWILSAIVSTVATNF